LRAIRADDKRHKTEELAQSAIDRAEKREKELIRIARRGLSDNDRLYTYAELIASLRSNREQLIWELNIARTANVLSKRIPDPEPWKTVEFLAHLLLTLSDKQI